VGRSVAGAARAKDQTGARMGRNCERDCGHEQAIFAITRIHPDGYQYVLLTIYDIYDTVGITFIFYYIVTNGVDGRMAVILSSQTAQVVV
jgi:hypothetical protein